MKRYGKWILWSHEEWRIKWDEVKNLPEQPFEIERRDDTYLMIRKVIGTKIKRWVIENINGKLICRRILNSEDDQMEIDFEDR